MGRKKKPKPVKPQYTKCLTCPRWIYHDHSRTGPKRKYCHVCMAERRRETLRVAQQRQRDWHKAEQEASVTEFASPDSFGSFEAFAAPPFMDP